MIKARCWFNVIYYEIYKCQHRGMVCPFVLFCDLIKNDNLRYKLRRTPLENCWVNAFRMFFGKSISPMDLSGQLWRRKTAGDAAEVFTGAKWLRRCAAGRTLWAPTMSTTVNITVITRSSPVTGNWLPDWCSQNAEDNGAALVWSPPPPPLSLKRESD